MQLMHNIAAIFVCCCVLSLDHSKPTNETLEWCKLLCTRFSMHMPSYLRGDVSVLVKRFQGSIENDSPVSQYGNEVIFQHVTLRSKNDSTVTTKSTCKYVNYETRYEKETFWDKRSTSNSSQRRVKSNFLFLSILDNMICSVPFMHIFVACVSCNN